jgi:hypothetical protein
MDAAYAPTPTTLHIQGRAKYTNAAVITIAITAKRIYNIAMTLEDENKKYKEIISSEDNIKKQYKLELEELLKLK